MESTDPTVDVASPLKLKKQKSQAKLIGGKAYIDENK